MGISTNCKNPVSGAFCNRFNIVVCNVDGISVSPSSALEQAFESDKPAVVDVKKHLEGIAPPAWRPK